MLPPQHYLACLGTVLCFLGLLSCFLLRSSALNLACVNTTTNHDNKYNSRKEVDPEHRRVLSGVNLCLQEQCVETQKPTPKSAQERKNNHKIFKCVTTANRDNALFRATTFCGAAHARIVLHFNFKRLILGSFHLSRLRASNPLLGALLGGSFAVRNAGHFSRHLGHLLLPVLHTLGLLHLPRRSFLFLNVGHIAFLCVRKPLLG
mmetsp:Transcript_35072/g.78531  ORF Transcript_35072/g.78531 Transcript_35072/m.78531 type:complete len:205 (-) Transcript_35072:66-680(-)